MPAQFGSGTPIVAARHSQLILPVILALFLASACSLLGDAAPSDSGPNPQHLEKSTIRVGAISAASSAPLYLALRNGYFAQQGLTVVPVVTTGGAQALPQLSSGDLDITLTNDVTAIAAQVKKTPDLRFVFDGVEATRQTYTVDTLPDSGINTIADLAGKKVGVSTLDDIVTFALQDAFRASNVDPKAAQFVVIPYAQSGEALRTHQVDAVTQTEPYITQAQQQVDAKRVVDVFADQGPNHGMPVAAYVATAKLTGQAPKTIAAFQRAMALGARDAANRANVERILPTYAKIDPTTAMLMALPAYPTGLNRIRLQRDADLMLTYGALRTRFDVRSMIVPTPAN